MVNNLKPTDHDPWAFTPWALCEVCQFHTSDGYQFYYTHYSPVQRPRARLVMLHGIRSHGGWYRNSCAKLAAAGFEVFVLDRRGSGLNTAHRGDCPVFRRLMDDVAEFVQHLRQARAWLPIFVAGISWGGKLAVGLAKRKPGLVDGMILLCPGLKPKVSPVVSQRLRVLVASLLRPTKFFPIPLNEPKLFTASPQWQHFIATNRHDLHEATARFLLNSVAFDVYLKRAVKCVTGPSLTLLAGRDQIIDNALTRRFVASFPSRDNRVIDYPDAEHTLELEGNSHPFVDDVVRWVERRIG